MAKVTRAQGAIFKLLTLFSSKNTKVSRLQRFKTEKIKQNLM